MLFSSPRLRKKAKKFSEDLCLRRAPAAVTALPNALNSSDSQTARSRQYSFRAGALLRHKSSLNFFAFFLKRGDEKSTRLRSSERFYHNFFHFGATERKNTVPCYRAPNLLIFSCLHCPVSAAQLLIFRIQLYGQFSTSKRQFRQKYEVVLHSATPNYPSGALRLAPNSAQVLELLSPHARTHGHFLSTERRNDTCGTKREAERYRSISGGRSRRPNPSSLEQGESVIPGIGIVLEQKEYYAIQYDRWYFGYIGIEYERVRVSKETLKIEME